MKTLAIGCLVAVASLVPAGSLLAHHSLANYDTTRAVRVKGRVVRFHQVNPHTVIFLDQEDAGGERRRWAIEGPSILQLRRGAWASDVLTSGDMVEVCGYLPKDKTIWQVPGTDAASTIAGQLINAEVLVMPDGRERSWGDYGVHKCFPPGYRDQHSK